MSTKKIVSAMILLCSLNFCACAGWATFTDTGIRLPKLTLGDYIVPPAKPSDADASGSSESEFVINLPKDTENYYVKETDVGRYQNPGDKKIYVVWQAKEYLRKQYNAWKESPSTLIATVPDAANPAKSRTVKLRAFGAAAQSGQGEDGIYHYFAKEKVLRGNYYNRSDKKFYSVLQATKYTNSNGTWSKSAARVAEVPHSENVLFSKLVEMNDLETNEKDEWDTIW